MSAPSLSPDDECEVCHARRASCEWKRVRDIGPCYRKCTH